MQVTERIHQITIPFSLKISESVSIERKVNVFILLGKRIVLIDAGPKGSEEIIFNYLKEIGRSYEEIKYILLTHSHPDHIGAVAAIKATTDCKVCIHEAEKQWLSEINYQFEQRPLPNFYDLVAESVRPDFLLKDGEILDVDEKLRFKVIHTPGHSPGSVSFLFQQDNALFTGDAIPLKHVVPVFDSWHESLASLEKIENLPYPQYLFSSWDMYRKHDEVQDFISEGIEWMYEIFTAYDKFSRVKEIEPSTLARYILKELRISEDDYNPLYERTIFRMRL
jgi:glyoxylase-like metal-dependent hydrolase (beta-lactamase superfamily II)